MQISPATIKNIDHAANLILKGGLVAFPTETVYGIGAIASNKNAINRIYSIKGRPKKNPLIVHIHSIDQVSTIVKCDDNTISIIMEKFWPGPLTIVLEINENCKLAKTLSQGRKTLAVRVPSHPVALDLLKKL